MFKTLYETRYIKGNLRILENEWEIREIENEDGLVTIYRPNRENWNEIRHNVNLDKEMGFSREDAIQKRIDGLMYSHIPHLTRQISKLYDELDELMRLNEHNEKE